MKPAKWLLIIIKKRQIVENKIKFLVLKYCQQTQIKYSVLSLHCLLKGKQMNFNKKTIKAKCK